MDEKYRKLNLLYKEIWNSMKTDINPDIKKYNYDEQKRKEKEFDILIDNIIRYIESFPRNAAGRAVWKSKGYKYIDKIILSEDIFKLGVIDTDMKDGFIRATKDFFKASREFDRFMSYEDIGQAMRNVWIVNIMQQAFGEKIKFNNAVFGYSMLYPYTDNYLDNAEINVDEKNDFNDRFTKRLSGEYISALNEHEERVYKLVELIEEQFNREKYPEVYKSLKLIHKGQISSLKQQEEAGISSNRDILGITIEKGGASVIADGNLIRGSMNDSEEIFSCGYGFLLQLGDDLQDIKVDKSNNHTTIMSQAAEKYYLDKIVNKLINLTAKVVDNAECFVCKNYRELKELIKNNCNYMVLFAVVDNKEFFSKEYIEKIEKFLPFTLEYCINLKENVTKRFNKLKEGVNGAPLDEIIMYFVE